MRILLNNQSCEERESSNTIFVQWKQPEHSYAIHYVVKVKGVRKDEEAQLEIAFEITTFSQFNILGKVLEHAINSRRPSMKDESRNQGNSQIFPHTISA